MFKQKSMALAIGVVALLQFYPQATQANSFKASEFLEWNDSSKELFLDSAILMAGSIASLNTKGQGRCVYDWYFGHEVAEARQAILDVMAKHPDHPPTGVIIAVAQKQCGTFRYRAK